MSPCLLVSISHAFAPSVEATRSPGAEAFQTDLFTGRLSTSVPIAVPPGRGNIQPQLALEYQSGGDEGWCGVGWTLDLGVIERSTKKGVPTYDDAKDTFTASINSVHSELVAIGNGEYRPKIEEAFMKFLYTGGQWRVWDKTGTVYRFGTSTNSQMNTAKGTFRWYLDSVTDVHGNTMTVSYTHDQKEVYLSHIAYTDNYYTVDFESKDRPDISTSVLSGEVVVTAQRLETIRVKANGLLVRRYELTYQQSPASDRSLLSRVTLYGNDDGATPPPPPMTFSYYTDVGRPSQDQNGTSHYFGYLPFAGSFRGHGLDIGLFDQSPNPDKRKWVILQRGSYDGSLCEFDPDTTAQPADLNGDGLIDACVHQDSGAGEWQVALAEPDSTLGCKFGPLQTWHPGFGAGQQAIGGDFNGDGFADVGAFNKNSGEWLIAPSDGTKCIGPTQWINGFGVGATPLNGDFNGDGLTDAGAFYNDGRWEVALSNGSRFLSPETWLTGFGAGKTSFTGDFNVDGRTDVGVYDQGTWQIAISRGQGFAVFDTGWLTGFGGGSDWLPFAGNFDNTGRTVAGIYNTGTGEWKLKTFAPDAQPPDALIKIDNSVGGTSTTRYAPYDPNDATFLPFPVLVVTQTTNTDAVTGNSFTTRYEYNGCLYDGTNREFRGFVRARIMDGEGNVTETWFHQDEIFKGKPQRIQQRDSAGNLYTEAQNTWQSKLLYPGVTFPFLAQADGFTYDGDASFKQTRTQWEYDDYGNVTKVHSDGNVADPSDDRRAETTYAPFNLTAWLIGLPQQTQTVDATGTVAQRTFYYDDSESIGTMPTKGHLTMVEDLLISDPSKSPRARMKYDPYGNLIETIDANDHSTFMTYDDTIHTYPTLVKNHLGQEQASTYDLRMGLALTTTDPNQQVTENRYDAFGRLIKVIRPLDSETYPTVTYEYDLSSTPTRTITRRREQHGTDQTLESITYFDGFGRPLQTRTEAEDPGLQIVTQAVTYNFRGQAAGQWLPYFITKNAPYAPPTPSDPKTTFEYDPMGRLIRTLNPEGTERRAQYNDWVVTTIDENGHQKVSTSDAYGRLKAVQEYNGAEVYTTTYTYNARDSLTMTQDAKGHIINMAYDSLGRKIFMNDPDMGFWQYQYDIVGNLRFQTDAKNQTIEFRYDELNRLKEKYYPGDNIPDVTYTYGNTAVPNGIGRLASVVDSSGETQFEYDDRGREKRTVRRIDEKEYAVGRTYDAMDRLTRLTYPDGEGVTYTYNASGQLERVEGAAVYVENMDYRQPSGQLTLLQYGNGVKTNYTYDAKTLRLDTLKSDKSGTPLQDFAYRYDNVGNVLGITDAVNRDAAQSFLYDALNRLTHASGKYGSFDYAYDSIGNLIRKGNVTLSYGEGAGPHAVTNTSDGLLMTYDANGNMVQKGAMTLRYDDENRLVEVDAPQQGRQTVTLHLGQGWTFLSLPVIPDSMRLADLLAKLSPSTDYEQVSRLNPGTSLFEHYLGEDASVARFNQFTDLEYGRGYEIYIKNPAGVTLSVEGKVPTTATPVTLSPGWNLIACPSLAEIPVGDAFRSLKIGVDYDAVAGYDGTQYQVYTGNPDTDTLKTLKPGQAYFIHCQRVSTWAPPLPTNRSQFVYDGDGGRVKKMTATGTTTYIGKLWEVKPDGSAVKYIWSGSARIASKSSTGKLLFYHPDHLGSTNLVTDAQGAQVARYEYMPWGEPFATEGADQVSHKFTGKELDPETGLYFYEARYYDPQLGRFITPDTFVPRWYDPQDLNRYTYANNNPIIYTDPTGHFSFKKFFRKFGSTILSAAAIIAAPFSGGASLALFAASAVVGGVQAAQAGQFGAWAAGFGISLAIGFAFPMPNISNLALRMGAGALRGAAIGAISGGVASVIGGGSFGAGAAHGAIGGAAGGAISAFFTSQQLKNWVAGKGFVSDRALLAAKLNARFQQELNVNATDKIKVTVGSHPVGPARHEYMRWEGGGFDMGPDEAGIIRVNASKSVAITDAFRANRPDLIRETTITVSRSALERAIAIYGEVWSGEPYSPLSYNSNYAVQSIIQAAGGEISENLGWAPEFRD